MKKTFKNSVALYEDYFKLQNVKEGERVAILSGQLEADPYIINAYQNALSNLGADYFTMLIPPKYKGLNPVYRGDSGSDFIFDALEDSSLILTLPGAMIISKTSKSALHFSIYLTAASPQETVSTA